MKTITVKNLDGTNENVEIVYYFDIKDLNKTFAIISKNERLKEGMSKVYISEVTEETPGLFKFVAITDESVWDNVKAAMKSIIQGNKMDSSKNISGVVELLGSRVIGIKDTDKEKFASISLESSFTIETPSETPEVSVTAEPALTPVTIVQTPAEPVPVQEPTPVVSEAKEEVKPAEAEPALESTNIFDQIAAASPAEPAVPVTPEVSAMPAISEPVVDAPSTETSTPIPEPANEPVVDVTPGPVSEPAFDMPEVSSEKLVTPQELYKQEEKTEKQKDAVEICFERIRAELMKKDEIIAELQAKIKKLESAQNMNYQKSMPDQTLSYKQAA